MSLREKNGNEQNDLSWSFHAENRSSGPQTSRRWQQNPSDRQLAPITHDRDEQGKRTKIAPGSVGSSEVPALREIFVALALNDAFGDGESYKHLIADVQQNPGSIVPYVVKIAADAKPSNHFGTIFVLDAPSAKYRVELVRGLVGQPVRVRVQWIGKSTLNLPSIRAFNEMRELESLVADVDHQLRAWFGGKDEVENLQKLSEKNNLLQRAQVGFGVGTAGRREARINSIYWNRASIEAGNCKIPMLRDIENEAEVKHWQTMPEELAKLRNGNNLTALWQTALNNFQLIKNGAPDLSSRLLILKLSLLDLSNAAYKARDALLCVAGESNAAVELDKKITELEHYFDSVKNNWR